MASRQSCFAVRTVSKFGNCWFHCQASYICNYLKIKAKKKQSVKLSCLWSPLMTSWGCHAMLRIGEHHYVTTLLMAAKRMSLTRMVLNTVSIKLQDFKR